MLIDCKTLFLVLGATNSLKEIFYQYIDIYFILLLLAGSTISKKSSGAKSTHFNIQ